MIGGARRVGRRAIMSGLALLALVGVAGCGTSEKVSSANVPFTVFTDGNQDEQRPSGVVVRDRNTLLDVLSETNAQLAFDRYPWRQDAAVLIFAGQQPNPGYRVVVDGLRRSGDELVAVAHVAPPPAGQVSPQMLASPFTAIEVSQADVANVRSVSVVWKS